MSALVQWMKKLFQNTSSLATGTISEPIFTDYENRFITLVKQSLLKDSVLYEGHKAVRGLANGQASYKWYAGLGPSTYQYVYNDITVSGPNDEELDSLYYRKIENEAKRLESIKIEKIKKLLDSEAEAG